MGSDLHRIRSTDLQTKMLWRRLKGSSPCTSVLTFRLPKQYIGPDTYRFADQNAFERFRTGTALHICQTLVPRRPDKSRRDRAGQARDAPGRGRRLCLRGFGGIISTTKDWLEAAKAGQVPEGPRRAGARCPWKGPQALSAGVRRNHLNNKGLAGSREGRTSPGGTAPGRREMPLEGAAGSVCGGSEESSQQQRTGWKPRRPDKSRRDRAGQARDAPGRGRRLCLRGFGRFISTTKDWLLASPLLLRYHDSNVD